MKVRFSKITNDDSVGFDGWGLLLSGLLVLLGLYLASLYSYLLFHALVEIFCIVVAFGIFVVAWNSRRLSGNGYFLLVGIAYLFVGGVDLIHTLAYKGMGVFPEYDANLPTQLWIAGRYVQSLSLLIAPLFLRRNLKHNLILGGYAIFIALLFLSIFYWHLFPDCFVEGMGLTAFKKTSEYVISLILFAAIGMMIHHQGEFDRNVFQLLIFSIVFTIGAELAFTSYINVYGLSNLFGHFSKFISFYLLYKAIIETSFRKPYDLLFRNLRLSEEMLRKGNEDLEIKVKERTAELGKTNEGLQIEITRRIKAEEELRESETRFRELYDDAPVGYHELDTAGRITRVNRTELAMLGYAPEEMLGKPVWEFVIEEETARQSVGAKMMGIIPAPRPFERTYRRKGGAPLPVLIEDRFLRNAEGQIKGIRSTIQDITERKRIEETLGQSEKRLRLLSLQLLTVQERERKRIAREVHDGLGQLLTAIKFKVENILHQIGKKETAESVKPLETIIPLIQESIAESRRIQMDLRPSSLDDLGILATLTWFCREFQKVYSGIRIEKEIDIQEGEVPDSLKTVIYRVSQEAFNNIAKHSRADVVRLHLRKRGETIELAVRDNGIGFNLQSTLSRASHDKGFGLSSMRERTELSFGSFKIESISGIGTTIRASWPCNLE